MSDDARMEQGLWKARVSDLGWFLVNLFQLLWLGAFTLFCFPPTMLVFAVTGNHEASFAVGRVFWGPLNMRFGFSSIDVRGKENLPPPGQPYVMMLNHQSMIDILVVWLICSTGPRFMAKKVLAYVPIVGVFMWAMGMVTIDRSNRHAAIAALRRAQAVVKSGHVLCAFPEGTRTRDGQIGPFKKGVFVVAQRSGVPIIPVAIDGAHILLPRNGWKPRPAVVRVNIGAPISTATRVRREVLIRQVRDAIIDLHLGIGGPGGNRALAIAGDDDDAEPSGDPRADGGSPVAA